MPFNAPATNVTIASKELVTQIETVAKQLEESGEYNKKYTTNNAYKSDLLNGQWKLLYSNGPEITSLAKPGNLPLGFVLSTTYQPINTDMRYFENNCYTHTREF